MRASASLLDSDRADLQCFVDDPLMVAAGTAKVRSNTFLMVVLFWRALGARLSWHKGARGTTITWIGAEITFDKTSRATAISLPAEKRQELLEACRTFLAQRRCDKRALRQLAGKASWIGSMLPQVRPFTQRIWAALASTTRPWVWTAQVEGALRWLEALASGGTGPFECRLPTDPPRMIIVIGFDAALKGGGACIWRVIVGADVRQATKERPEEYMAEVWTEADETLLGASRCEAASQPLWEGYMATLAIRSWWPAIVQAAGPVILRGDAQGVLQGFVRMKAKEPRLNLMAQELALLFGPRGRTLEGVHLWSEDNDICDLLSRLPEGAQFPPALEGVPRASRSTERFLVLGRAGFPAGAGGSAATVAARG